MLVQSADFGVAKEHAAAPVWLQSMLVRIDDNRVRFSEPRKSSPCFFPEVLCQHEIAAIRGIRVNPESVLCAQRQNLRQRIHRTCCGGTHCCYNRPAVAAL